MELSRENKTRLQAAVSVVIVMVILFGGLLIIKLSRTFTVSYYDGDECIKTETVRWQQKLNKWTPESEGKVFLYWSDSIGMEYDFDERVTDDLRLYARWQ